MSELCDRYQLSWPNGYKRVDRIEMKASQPPKIARKRRLGTRTERRVEREILTLREKNGWGR